MTDFVILPIDIPTLALSRGMTQLMMGGLLLYLGRRDEYSGGATFGAIGFLLNGVDSSKRSVVLNSRGLIATVRPA
jgi:hypothetical protein